MIKKPTLIVLLCAVVLGGLVYYFDWKRGNEEKPAVNCFEARIFNSCIRYHVDYIRSSRRSGYAADSLGKERRHLEYRPADCNTSRSAHG